jgi:hypothetical protein
MKNLWGNSVGYTGEGEIFAGSSPQLFKCLTLISPTKNFFNKRNTTVSSHHPYSI